MQKIWQHMGHLIGASRRRAGLGRYLLPLALAILTPSMVLAQDAFAEDTLFYDDEYYDDDYDSEDYFEDDYYDDEFADDEYYDDEYSEGDDEFFDEADEFSDEGFDEEGFDEFDDGEFSDEFFDDDAEFEDAAADGGINLADDRAGEVELGEVEQKEIKEPRIPWGYTARITASSPWLVGMGLTPWWYSFIDGRVTLDFPTKTIAGQSLTYAVEISSFSFINNHPSKGTIQGISILGLAKFPWGPLEISAGAGLYGFSVLTGGMVFGASYTLPFIKLIEVTTESRLNYVMDSSIESAIYWMDISGSIGVRF